MKLLHVDVHHTLREIDAPFLIHILPTPNPSGSDGYNVQVVEGEIYSLHSLWAVIECEEEEESPRGDKEGGEYLEEEASSAVFGEAEHRE